jgi:hypothetical protein
MKKLFLSICLLLFANVLLAQSYLAFEVDNIKYDVNGNNSVKVIGHTITQSTALVIPQTVTNDYGVTYNVTAIEYSAFYGCSNLTSVVIGDNVTTIGDSAFYQCTNLTSVVIGDNVTTIGNNAFYMCWSMTSVVIGDNVTTIGEKAFCLCTNLTSAVIGNNVTTIGDEAFHTCWGMTSVVIGNSVTHIGSSAFYGCGALQDITILAENPPTYGINTFHSYNLNGKPLTVPFGATGYTPNWGLGNYYSWGKINHKINEGETKVLSTVFEITEENKREIINEGVLRIAQGGELIGDVSGIVEVETPLLDTNKWHIIGAPFANYKLETLIPGALDPTCLLFDYNNNTWSDTWAHISNSVATGEGFYAFPWNGEALSFTNYGDGICSPNARDEFINDNYDFDVNPAYQINTGDVTINRTLGGDEVSGRWLPLANPYTFKLDVAKFIAENSSLIQGGVWYKLNGTSYQPIETGDIKVTEGFFVNATSNNVQNMKFTPSQRFVPTAKASVEREFISLVMIDQEREIEVLFAQNEEAQEGYDRFDANKLFSPYEIAEPYFITNNIALVKEEVNTLPYYATMNVRSYENKEVKFRANYIPEGYSLSLIDGEETIDLLQGQEYSTLVSRGENANRFKLLIKKSVGLGEVEELEVEITNSNRLVNVSSTEEDLQIEVYNALGQKVFATKDRNFTLNNVSAGAYVVKAFNNKASKTQKIVIK